MADANETYYYHFDGLGSVVALSDVNNVLVERYAYDVFGRPTIRDANGAEIGETAVGNPYLFTGRRYDAETALYYYRARYYDYYAGRFLQPDPLGYTDGLNLYSYVGNNPTSWLDPFGLCKEVDLDELDRVCAESTFLFDVQGFLDFREFGVFVFRDTRTGKIIVLPSAISGDVSSVSWKQAWEAVEAMYGKDPMFEHLRPIAFVHRHGAPEWLMPPGGIGRFTPDRFSPDDQQTSVRILRELSHAEQNIWVYLVDRHGEMRRYNADVHGGPSAMQTGQPGTYVGNREDLRRGR